MKRKQLGLANSILAEQLREKPEKDSSRAFHQTSHYNFNE